MPHVAPWVAVVAGFVVALACAPAEVSGAFPFWPFQVSVLGFVSPAAAGPTSSTTSWQAQGVVRYLRERRFDWSLSRVIAVGTAPGVIFGVFHRVSLLRSPDRFRIFMGVVLLTLAIKLVVDLMLIHGARRPRRALGASQRRWVVLVSVVVGFVGGVYGIGGGSIIAPFLVAVLGLSIYRVAGAALFATFVTFVTSVVGVLAFTNPGTPGG